MNLAEVKGITIPEGDVYNIASEGSTLWQSKAVPFFDVPVADVAAYLKNEWNLQPGSYAGKKDTSYYTYFDIPIVPGATYYAYYGTRSWFSDENLGSIKTCNLRTCDGTGSKTPYEFVAPENAYYIRISYNYDTVASDNVFIRRVA